MLSWRPSLPRRNSCSEGGCSSIGNPDPDRNCHAKPLRRKGQTYHGDTEARSQSRNEVLSVMRSGERSRITDRTVCCERGHGRGRPSNLLSETLPGRSTTDSVTPSFAHFAIFCSNIRIRTRVLTTRCKVAKTEFGQDHRMDRKPVRSLPPSQGQCCRENPGNLVPGDMPPSLGVIPTLRVSVPPW